MANHFRKNLEQISSSVYPRYDHSYASNPEKLLCEPSDVPLDAFDQELLAECPLERPLQYEDGSGRALSPPMVVHTPINREFSTRVPRDVWLSPPFQPHRSSSSSSSFNPVSSPTVVALQNRNPVYLPSLKQTQRDEKRKSQRFNQQDGDSIPSNRESISMSPQGESQVKQKYPLPGGVTRLGLGHAPPIVQGIHLIATTELPDRYRSIFTFPMFNAVQSKCFSVAFQSNDNLVVSAPTGSGKTAVMEVAICQLLHSNKAGDFKIVYQSPTKALCAERMRDWSRKFASLDLTCAELTGDTEQAQLREVQSASIIITTPEKWDCVTRKWRDNAKLMKMVKLFLIDEVHILKEVRGATLEAVVSRMKLAGSNVRFIALSATVPNSDDIATWLGKSPDTQDLPAHREVFGERYRPVKLEKHVWAVRGPTNDFAFDKILDESLRQALAAHSRKKPTMIFCCTRKMTVDTAKMLANLFSASHPSYRLWSAPRRNYKFTDSELSKTVATGVAFHHGGVDVADRRVVEDGFLHNDISIICCTSTLSVGVNLPCYLVIIKGTVSWTDKGIQEYPDLEIMQMLGRAGRPQFETTACAVILTRPQRKEHYERMASGEEILESSLHINLIDHLNSEVGLGTVHDIESAKKWLVSTFLFVRLQKNPCHYQLQEPGTQVTTEEFLEGICTKDIALLQEARLISESSRFKCTQFGDAMARYFVKFETMKTILAMPPKAKLSDALSTLVQASEFADIRIKSGEKGLYKELNGDVAIKFPVKVDIAQNFHKVSLLIQSELGGSIFPGHEKWKKHRTQFNLDKATVFSHVNRLIRCMIDCQLHLDDAISVRHSLELARSLAAKVWDNSVFQLKQIDGIGDVGVRKLAQAGVDSIETLQNMEPHRIENIFSRLPPFGQKILSKAAEFPSLRVSIKEMKKERQAGQWVKINLKIDVGFVNEKIPVYFRRKMVYVCFIAETSDGKLIDFRRWAAKRLENGQEFLLSVQLAQPTSHIICQLMCDEIAGTSRRAELKLDKFPSSCFPSPKPVAFAQQGISEVARPPTDFDCYDGLEDADLIALLDDQEGRIEVIHDLDDAIHEKSNDESTAKDNIKPYPEMVSAPLEINGRPYKEPGQLENGNWTCQHTCRERGKICKHVCCTDGVKEPSRLGLKRSTRKLSKNSDAAGIEAVNKTTTKSSGVSKLQSGKLCLQTIVKKRKLSNPIVGNANETKNTIQVSQKLPRSQSLRTPVRQDEVRITPKVSFIENRHSLIKKNDYSKAQPPSVAGDSKETRNLLTQNDSGLPDVDFDADDFDFDIDDDIDALCGAKQHILPVGSSVQPSTTILNYGSDNQTAGTTARRRKVKTKVEPRNRESKMQEALRDCAPQKDAKRQTELAISSLREMPSPKAQKHVIDGNTANSRFDDEVGIGGLHSPPPSLLTQGNKEKFITGNRSSPTKQRTDAASFDDEEDAYGDPGIDSLIAALESSEYDNTRPVAKKTKLAHDTFTSFPNMLVSVPKISSPKNHTDLSSGKKGQVKMSTKTKDPQMSLSSDSTQFNWPGGTPMNVQHSGREIEPHQQEKQEMVWKNHNQKWGAKVTKEDEDALDAAFYAEFGDFIEIV